MKQEWLDGKGTWVGESDEKGKQNGSVAWEDFGLGGWIISCVK